MNMYPHVPAIVKYNTFRFVTFTLKMHIDLNLPGRRGSPELIHKTADINRQS